MLWNKKHAGIAVTLIICIAFFMSGGVPHAAGETLLLKPEFIEVIKPEFMEVTEFEFMDLTKPEFLEGIEFEFTDLTKPEFFVPTVSSSGLTIRGGELKSVEQIMCGPSNGLPTPKKCLFKGQ